MKKSTLLMIVSVVLAMTLSLGGTLAYLQDSDADVNVMTLGNVNILQNEQQRVKDADGKFTNELEEYKQNKILMPYVDIADYTNEVVIGEYDVTLTTRYNNYVDKIVSVTNTGKSDAYVRTLVAIPTGGEEWTPDVAAADCWLHWNYLKAGMDYWTLTDEPVAIELDGRDHFVWEFVHEPVLEAKATTFPSIVGFFMDKRVNNDENGFFITYKGSANYADGTVKRIEDFDFDDVVEIRVLSQGVQAAGFEALNGKTVAKTALDEGFGEFTAANVAQWFGADFPEAGSPGDENDTNNPPVLVSTAAELEAALEAGATAVTLTEDITLAADLNAESLTLFGDSNIDMAGKTLTTNGGLYIEGNVTLENGSIAENGAGAYGPISQLGSDVTYNNTNIVTAGGGLNVRDTVVWNEGNITINNATSSPRHMFYVAAGNPECNGHLTINGGEFSFNPKNLTRRGSYICAHGEGATVIVNGGTFHKPSTRTAPIQAIDGGTVTIYGGSFAFDPSAFVADGYEAVQGENGYWTVSAITE